MYNHPLGKLNPVIYSPIFCDANTFKLILKIHMQGYIILNIYFLYCYRYSYYVSLYIGLVSIVSIVLVYYLKFSVYDNIYNNYDSYFLF